MTKAELKRLWKGHYAGLQRTDERIIEERRMSSADERMTQADLWFNISGALDGKSHGKQEEQVREIWVRLHRAFARRQTSN
jgi:hypothetical protein